LVGLVLALYFHFGSRKIYLVRDGDLNPSLRGLLVALFAVLLATQPLDFMAQYRGYWAKMFLLKPNHALGLLMVPFLVTLMAKNTWPRSAFAGLWLGLLGWVFIIHWGFVSAGLVGYLLLGAFLKKRSVVPEIPKFAVVIMVGLLVALPYIYLLATYFPHAVTLARGANPDFPTRSTWGDMLATGSSLFFRVTFDLGPVFYLGLFGVADWVRRRGRAEILWASMVVSAYLLWCLNVLLYYTARAREADEFYYFLVFVLSIAAGNGAYRLASLVSILVKGVRLPHSTASAAVPVLVVVATTTLVSPYWWHPLKMDAHYRASLRRLPHVLTDTRDWILEETNADDIFISSSELGQWIPALTGRRLLYPYRQWREDVRLLMTELDYEPEWAETQTVYVVFDDSLSEMLKVEKDVLEKNPRIKRVRGEVGVVVYRILRASQVE
jgi:hypothetical protein